MRQSAFRWLAVLGAVTWLTPGGAVHAVAPAAGQAAKGTVATTTTGQSGSRTSAPQKSSGAKSAPAAKKTYSPSRSAARRAQLARARAAKAQREAREAAQPRYKLDESGALVPDLRAEAAIIYNPVTQEVLWAQNENSERSIASITKVMTAVVFLENEFDLDRQVVVDRADVRGARVTYLRSKERVAVRDLLHLLLIASDNAAARTLARVSPWGAVGFIARMNEKAAELGLTSTHYEDPSGLYSANVSSAYDMARLIAFASSDERIAAVMRKSDHTLKTNRRTVTVHNTNRLVGSEIDVRAGKTGFISKSGYCLATLLRLPQSDEQVAVVVLGARSNAGRFWETRHLFNWLTWKTSQIVGDGGNLQQ